MFSFERYGHPTDNITVGVSEWLIRPDKIDNLDAVARADKAAARLIKACQAMIENATEYRTALVERYNQLATMAYSERLTLERRVGYDKKKTFYIRRIRLYEDGTKIVIETETYSGSERRIAINRFEELLKKYPGIEFEKDIEKKSWEK